MNYTICAKQTGSTFVVQAFVSGLAAQVLTARNSGRIQVIALDLNIDQGEKQVIIDVCHRIIRVLAMPMEKVFGSIVVPRSNEVCTVHTEAPEYQSITGSKSLRRHRKPRNSVCGVNIQEDSGTHGQNHDTLLLVAS